MNQPTSEDRRASRHRRRVRTLRRIALSIAGLTVLLVLVINRPVQDAFRRRDRFLFVSTIDLATIQLRQFFAQSAQVAGQIPSRTQIRRALAEYVAGERELDSFVAFTEPRLRDAVDASQTIRAVVRFNATGEQVAQAYAAGLDLPPPRFSVLTPTITVRGDGSAHPEAVFVTVPIVTDGSGLIGYDTVVIDAGPMSATLARLAGTLPDSYVRIEQIGSDGSTLVARSGSLTGVPDSRREQETRPIGFGMSLLVEQSHDALYERTRREIGYLTLFTLVLGGATTLLVLALTESLERDWARETASLEQIIAEQTGRLQAMLASRETLLREVHHRIKNDLAMVEAMLAIQERDLTTEEARAAVADARERVSLVGWVYDQLYRAEGFETVRVKPVFEQILETVHRTRRPTNRQTRFNLAIADLELTRDVAIPLGIIVNELVVNSFKHAPGDPLAVDVTLDRRGVELELVVTDSGAGRGHAARGGNGYGLQMVEALTGQLGGRLDHDPSGGATRLVCPAEPHSPSEN